MSEPPRGRRRTPRLDEPKPRPTPRPRSASELDSVVRDFATRVQRLEKELADLREIFEGLGVPTGQPAQIR